MATGDPSRDVDDFPGWLPRSVRGSWAVLTHDTRHVEVEQLPDYGLRVQLRKNPRAKFMLVAVLTFIGVTALLTPWVFGKLQSSPMLDLPIRYDLTKLYLLSGMCSTACLTLALVNLVVSQRDTIFEVRQGWLKVDRWASGDHLVREYVPAQIAAIWVDIAITIGTKPIEISVGMFSPDEIRIAATEIVGAVFWGDRAAVARNVPHAHSPNGRMKILLHALEPVSGDQA